MGLSETNLLLDAVRESNGVTPTSGPGLGSFINNALNEIRDWMDDYVLLISALASYKTALDELIDDHATFKAAADAVELLIEELADDHATVKTMLDDLKIFVNSKCQDGVIQHAHLAVSALDATKFKTQQDLYYRKYGIQMDIAASDLQVFSSNFVINSVLAT